MTRTFFYLINRYKIEFNSNKKVFAEDLVKQGYSKEQVVEICLMTRRYEDERIASVKEKREAKHLIDFSKKFEVKG